MDADRIQQAKRLLISGLRGEGAHLDLETAVAEFPDQLINTRPPNVPYTFWGQLEHIRRAQEDLWRYAADPQHVSPAWPDGYWPEPEQQADRETWDRTVAAIIRDRERFIALIDDPQTEIFAPVEHMRGGSVFRTALLAIDHTAYHLGEFVMGRQILGYWESNLKG